MSKSSPPASSIESLPKKLPPSKLARDDVGHELPLPPSLPPKSKTLSTQFAAVVRWLHIYVSLLGFTALIFFAITGITLNHPTWFGIEAVRTKELKGEVKKEWLNLPLSAGLTAPPMTEAGEIDYAQQVAKLE